jgi:hypothetical protein
MRQIISILTCVILMASCTENFSPNIDYGTHTYVNDYSTLSKLLEDGLAKIRLSIDEQTGAIKVMDASITTTLLNGFSMVNTSIDEQTNTLKVAIDANTTALADLSGDIVAAIRALRTAVEAQGGKLITAVNDSGEVIAIAINGQNEVIGAMQIALVDAIKANTTTLFDIIKTGKNDVVAALGELGDDLIAAINADDQDLLEELKKANANIALLVEMQDGIRLVNKNEDDKYEKMYIDPDKWEALQANPTLKAIYQNLLISIHATKPEPKQWVCAAHVEEETESHEHSIWTFQEAASDGVLAAVDVVTINEYTSTVVQNISVWTKYRLTIDSGCAYPYVFSVRVTDAKGTNRQVVGTADGPTVVYNGQADYGVVTIYNYDSGTYVSETSAKVYSSNI